MCVCVCVCVEMPEFGRDEEREGYTISFHELQVNARNEVNGRDCRELPGAATRWQRWGEGGVMRRTNKSWQRLAEMREGDGKPQASMTCQVMVEMRGFERAAASCRLLPKYGGGGGVQPSCNS